MRTLPALLIAAMAFSPAALAETDIRAPGSVGVGLGAGTLASGISGKLFISEALAAQALLGIGGYKNNAAGLSGGLDLLVEMPAIADTPDIELGWNLGVGGALGVGNGLFVGAAGVAGIEAALKPVPLDLTLEYRPVLGVVNGLVFDPFHFGGHLRYWF